MNRSDTITELAKALVKAQAAIQPAVKDKTNPAFRSRYADLSSVWDACRKPLTDNGLSIVQMPIDAEPGRVALETILLHSSGEYISSTVSTALVKTDPQGVGSALTYLRRYALSAVVGVVADEDDDGNAASKAVPRPLPARAPLPTKPNGNPVARAIDLFNIAKDQGIPYRAPAKFKDMEPAALAAEIQKLERLIADATPADDSEWDEIDAASR